LASAIGCPTEENGEELQVPDKTAARKEIGMPTSYDLNSKSSFRKTISRISREWRVLRLRKINRL
jgi:hypothetical protein